MTSRPVSSKSLRGQAPCFDDLRTAIGALRVIDTHDHTARLGPRYDDPVQVIVGEYMLTDLAAATSEEATRALLDSARPLEERWPLLARARLRAAHTGFAQITRRVLHHFYGEDDVTLEALQRMQDRLLNLEEEQTVVAILDQANIVARLVNVWPDFAQVLDGSFQLTPRARLVIPLPGYHNVRSFMEIQAKAAPFDRSVSTLDEYLEICWAHFQAYKRFGAVAFKDQSAYFRTLDYGNPTKADAERLFNRLMADATRSAGYPDELKPLDDYLFHSFLRMARDLDLPVQLHTGHLAGLYGDIRKANAAKMADLFLLHRDVRFDLFHANWPYGGELLFLAKAFPNVAMNFCWVHAIDPLYCQSLIREAVSAVPHAKVHAFGADYGGFGLPPGGGYVDRAWAHVQLALDNMAIALSDLVSINYLRFADAEAIAACLALRKPEGILPSGPVTKRAGDDHCLPKQKGPRRLR